MEMNDSISHLIKLFFINFGFAMLVLALITVVINLMITKRRVPLFEVVFRWVAFFALGVTGLYTGFLHAFYPDMSAANIGWPTSPFQFEVAMADFAIGILGLSCFKASHGFRLATVVAATIFLWGDAIGHLNQMLRYQNFAPGNAGSWFWLDVLVPFILMICMTKLKRTRRLFT